ncbi:serine hydrolase domain-containing protein [Candidatus Binatus sp.]|uniref:serine hydrolase domain-containing protein n=1 Tax=Candidatus Binatus sp. TaxID=2811406 RepID=UPI003CB42D51
MISANRRPFLALLLSLAGCLIFAASASAAPWTQPGFLYRYFVWGAQFAFTSRADDYKRYGSHPIDKGPDAYHFAPGNRNAVPDTVEYKEGDAVKRVALSELLRSTGTHAFIVIRDNQVLYEDYFNGYARDSLCTAWSVSKSVASALVGIAIAEGYIKSLDDPITNYLPELKDQGFSAITIRNLLTMGSGIQYRIGFFPWDEFVLAGYYPNLRQLLLSDLKIMEPPGQSFHYNNFNVELLGLILERTTHRSASQYLQEKIWEPIGMEYPATWSIDSDQDGFELTPILLNARAIDLAKFGRLYLNNGNWDGKQIVPENWVAESTVRDPNDHRPWETFSRWQDNGGYYKYLWWGVSQGKSDYSYIGIGTYGQFIFVSPKTKVVIVRTADKDGIDPPYWREVFQHIADHVDENYRRSEPRMTDDRH